MNRQNRGEEVLVYCLSLLKGFYPWAIAAVAGALLLLLHVPDEFLMALAAILAVGLLVYYRYLDVKKLKQRPFESLSPELKAEIDTERRTNIAKRQKFLDAMDKAEGGKNA